MCVDITSDIGKAMPITTSSLPYRADRVVARACLCGRIKPIQSNSSKH